MVIKAAFLVKVLYRGWPVTVCLVQRTCPDSSWKRSQSRKLCSRSEKLHPHHQRLHPGSPHRKSFTNLLTCTIGSLIHSPTHSINFSLTYTINQLPTHSHNQWTAHSLICSLTCSLMHSPMHSLIYSFAHFLNVSGDGVGKCLWLLDEGPFSAELYPLTNEAVVPPNLLL